MIKVEKAAKMQIYLRNDKQRQSSIYMALLRLTCEYFNYRHFYDELWTDFLQAKGLSQYLDDNQI